MEKKKIRRMRVAVSVLSVLLIICIGVLSVTVYKLNSVNLFSENIVLSSAAFFGAKDAEEQVA